MGELLKSATGVTVTVAWAILGLYIWIPALIISILAYSIGIFLSAIRPAQRVVKWGESLLDAMAPMYCNGFKRIRAAVEKSPESQTPEAESEEIWKVSVTFIVWFLGATLVWVILLFVCKSILRFLFKG